ncbi:MAG: hypothetical protein EA397_11530 [Deltaproteobacteria bacterium]|nr:MAG: hypothetical protein EA397_11530 [Deltaproteobacteria bacterium]
MRFISLTALTGLAVGCGASDADLVYRGTLNADTNGVVIYEDGRTGHAAMLGTTCAIDTSGGVADDVNIDGTSEDQVLDGSQDGDGSVVLARTQDFLHIISGTQTSWSWGPNLAVTHNTAAPGVTDGAMTHDGVVAWADCTVSWFDRDMNLLDSAVAPLDDCNATFAADFETGETFLANQTEIVRVTRDGADIFSDRADLMVFSPNASALVVADLGDSEVRALNLDGSLRWSTAVRGAVTDIEDLGRRGQVAVMLDHGDEGQLVLLDAETGDFLRDFSLPSSAEVVASRGGSTLGMVVDNVVHFYNLR